MGLEEDFVNWSMSFWAMWCSKYVLAFERLLIYRISRNCIHEYIGFRWYAMVCAGLRV